MAQWRVTVVVSDISEADGQRLVAKLLSPRPLFWSVEMPPATSTVITLPLEDVSEAAASDRALELVRHAADVSPEKVRVIQVREHTGEVG